MPPTRVRSRRNRRPSRRLDDDEEVGILPLLGALLPMVAPLLGGILGGGSKDAPAAAPPDISSMLAQAAPLLAAAGGGSSIPAGALPGVARDIMGAIPGDIRGQVTDALRMFRESKLSQAQAGQRIGEAVGAEFMPHVTAALAALNTSATQTQATDEHRNLVDRDAWRKEVRDGQQLIVNRLATLDKKLAVVKRVYGL
jgi:hypothetical protein